MLQYSSLVPTVDGVVTVFEVVVDELEVNAVVVGIVVGLVDVDTVVGLEDEDVVLVVSVVGLVDVDTVVGLEDEDVVLGDSVGVDVVETGGEGVGDKTETQRPS